MEFYSGEDVFAACRDDLISYFSLAVYVGMAYHPYGEGQPYTAHFATTYLDVKHHILLGRAFWDYLGGSGAYEDVLGIYRKVGCDKAPLIRAKAGIMSAPHL